MVDEPETIETRPTLFDNDPEMPPRMTGQTAAFVDSSPRLVAEEPVVVRDTSAGTTRGISGATWFAVAILVLALAVGQRERLAQLLPRTTQAQAATPTDQMVFDGLDLPTMTTEETGPYTLLAGSFRRMDFAKRLVLKLRDSGTEAHIVSLRIPEKGVFHRVVIDLGTAPSFGRIIRLKPTAESVVLSSGGRGTVVAIATVLKQAGQTTITRATTPVGSG